jgi:PAS domain S-box-containing protein
MNYKIIAEPRPLSYVNRAYNTVGKISKSDLLNGLSFGLVLTLLEKLIETSLETGKSFFGELFEMHSFVDLFLLGGLSTIFSAHLSEKKNLLEQEAELSHQREQKVLRNEALLKEAMDVAKMGHWELDLASGNLSWSDEIYKIFEMDPQSAIASYEHFLNNIHPDDREAVNNAYRNSLQNKTGYNIEHRLLINKHLLKYVQERCRTEYDSTGHPVRSIGTVQDITDRKEIELTLQKTSEIYFDLFNNAEVGMFRTLLDGSRVLNINDKFLKIVGMTREEVLGKPSVDLWVDPNERAEMVKILKSTGKVIDFEYKMLNRISGIRNCITSLRLYQDGTLIGSILDITDQKISQQALQVSEANLRKQNELFETLLKVLPNGVFMVDAVNGKPLIANNAAQELLGRGILPDTTKNNLSNVYKAFKAGTHDVYPVDEMPIVRGMAGEHSSIDDLIVERPDGTRTLLEIFGTPVKDENGTVWASLVSFQDISQRKLHEKLIRDAQKSEITDLIIGGIAHDFRNILAVVNGHSEIGIMHTLIKSEEQKRLRTILEAGQRGVKIINELTAFSRPEAELKIRPVDLNKLLKDTIDNMFHSHIKSTQIDWKLSENIRHVQGDPDRLNRAIMNLLINAIHAMESSQTKHLTFETKPFHLDHEQTNGGPQLKPGHYVEFSISDSGCGIPPENLEKIMLPYFTTKGVKGTGLGMHVIREIVVKQHGGAITIDSKVGEGTTIKVYVPVSKTEE